MRKRFSLVLVALLMCAAGLFAETDYRKGFQEYKLANGLTVFLWEDEDLPSVHGRVVTRAGSIDEPADYTGLAHYLEHMLFKGTDKIGALDWEKEKPLYDEIIALYDQLNKNTDPKKNDEIIKAINEKSLEAAKYTATDEFSNLTTSYGGSGLNAYTSYDVTVYFNDFPAGAMEKWLELNSERLMNPVFRSFQAELENVFEEFNISQDNKDRQQMEFWNSKAYAGTPYARSVIGTAAHLKNPSLSALINFYNTWYVPNNMCLMLVGNFDSEAVKPMIEKTFGRLQPKELPARFEYKETDLSGNQKYTAKMSDYPSIMWIYPGVKKGDKDELLLQFTLRMLNNGRNTGLLDKLMIDGTVNAAVAGLDTRRCGGRIIVQGVPYFDVQQRTWESNRATEKIIMAEVEKLKNGQVDEWLFNSVKSELLQGYETQFESAGTKVQMITDAFTYGISMDDYFNEKAAIEAITLNDVKACAAKYLSGDRMMVAFEDGETKVQKLPKPKIKPLEQPKSVESEYAKAFKKMSTTPTVEKYCDFNEVTVKPLYDGVTMHYTPNTKNDVFSLQITYKVGSAKLPKLEYAAQLLNSAGMMPNVSAQDLRRQYSELGATCGFSASDSYFTIYVTGEDKNLEQICKLVTRQTLMPNLDDKQIRSMISNAYWGRMNEKKNPSVVESALMEYIIYGDQSHYIDRILAEDLYKATVMPDGTFTESFLINKMNLTETINEATGYEVELYYCGTKPVDEVANILKGNTPIKDKTIKTECPVIRDKKGYEKTSIYFLPDTKSAQAKIYFYFEGKPADFKPETDARRAAFNQYFSGGFSGLVMNEIREKRSMAYTAYADFSSAARPDKDTYFIGYIGTQHDKVADAVDVFMNLVDSMPQYPERMEDIKTYLHQTAFMYKPSMRSKAALYESWKECGYTEDPTKGLVQAYDGMSYDDLLKFYQENVQGKPMTIVIIGDPKTINQKALKAKYGKLNKVSINSLFKGSLDEKDFQ